MDKNGWVKLYRKMTEWEWYQDGNTMRVFLHLLLTVNFKDKRWQGIVIQRGQKITSVKHLLLELNKDPLHPEITTRNIRTALTRLKSTNELTIKTTSKYTLITVNNYNLYQQVTNEMTNDCQTSDKQVTNDCQQLKNNKNLIRMKETPLPPKKFGGVGKGFGRGERGTGRERITNFDD